MNSSFDHYHKWLAIPPEHQPPNHYQLLGLQAFESDLDVIEAAADQRMAHIRSYQTGKNGDLAQQLLNELSAARIVLLDDRKRGNYDRQLRHAMPSEPAAQQRVQPTPQVAPAAPHINAYTSPFDLAAQPDLDASQDVLAAPMHQGGRLLNAGGPRRRTSIWLRPLTIIVALAAALLGVATVAIIALLQDNLARPATADNPSSEGPETPVADADAAQDSENAIEDALKTLRDEPDDPDANLIAGKYYCFDRGHWSRGLAMLSKSNDGLLQRLAKEDLSGDRDDSSLGAQWREAAQKQTESVRRRMLDRAAYWYVESLPNLSGAAEKDALKHVFEISERNSEVGLGDSIDLLALVDVDRHTQRGRWTRSGDEVSCDKGGSPLLLVPVMVRGAYRLEVTLTQLANDTIHLVLPAGLSQFNVSLHGYRGDLSEITVRRKPIVRQRPGRLELNKRHVVIVDVELDGLDASITVRVNGEPHLACKTALLSPDASSRHNNTLVIGGSGNSHFTVHTARLTMRSGGLRYTPDQEQGAIPGQ